MFSIKNKSACCDTMLNTIIMWLLILTVLYLLYSTNYEEIDEDFAVDHGTYSGQGYKCYANTSPLYQVVSETVPGEFNLQNVKCLGAFPLSNPQGYGAVTNNDCAPFPNYKNSYNCNKTLSSNTYKMYGADSTGNQMAPWANSESTDNIFTCNGPTTAECKSIYKNIGMKTIGESSYNCSYGNNTVPVKVSSENIVSCLTNGNNVLKGETEAQCQSLLTKSLANGTITTCTTGKVGVPCTNLYNALGLKSFAELGYSCYMIGTQNVIGLMLTNPYGFQAASYDGINPIVTDSHCTLLNFPPTSELRPIQCMTYNSPNSLCPTVFSEYNLYPTTNPLTIKQNNINQAEPLIIKDATTLYNLSTDNINALSQITGYDPNTAGGITVGLEGILNNYPVKVGCCSRLSPSENTPLNASVNVPLAPSTINPTLQKYNYQKKNLTIPAETCPANLYAGSTMCDAFYDVNCENQLANFKTLNLPVSEFSDYSPSCACYTPKLESQQQYSNNIPPKCYKDGCGTQTSYIDPVSRTNQCNLTICSSIVNLNDVSAGQGVALNNQITNSCGNFLSEIYQNNTLSPTTNTGGTSTTNNTGGTSTTPTTHNTGGTGSTPTTNNTSGTGSNPTTNNTSGNGSNPTTGGTGGSGSNPTTNNTGGTGSNPTTNNTSGTGSTQTTNNTGGSGSTQTTTNTNNTTTTPPVNNSSSNSSASSSNNSIVAYLTIGFVVFICCAIIILCLILLRRKKKE